jgi:hypothetical protein
MLLILKKLVMLPLLILFKNKKIYIPIEILHKEHNSKILKKIDLKKYSLDYIQLWILKIFIMMD